MGGVQGRPPRSAAHLHLCPTAFALVFVFIALSSASADYRHLCPPAFTLVFVPSLAPFGADSVVA